MERENGSGDSGVRESIKSPLCHAGKKYLKAFIPNYPINLVDVGRLGRLDGFQTDLQVVFGMIKYKGSRYKKEIQSYVNEHREYFGCLSWDDFLAIREMMNLNKKMEKI